MFYSIFREWNQREEEEKQTNETSMSMSSYHTYNS